MTAFVSIVLYVPFVPLQKKKCFFSANGLYFAEMEVI